jgi:N-glycosidase YbiA
MRGICFVSQPGILSETGMEEIVEDALGDDYWGCGTDRTGQNKLRQLLMDVREQLRKML